MLRLLTRIDPDKEHPLAGTVLCFTSVLPEQRVRFAFDMGGQLIGGGGGELLICGFELFRLSCPPLRVRWERRTSTT